MLKEEIEFLAKTLFEKHELDKQGWVFRFDTSKKRFGCCFYGRKVISLSLDIALLNSEEEIKETLLHEIAHALVGPGYGHGEFWKCKAKMIGASPERCYSLDKVITPSLPKYIYVCKNCNHTISLTYRLRTVLKACKKCCIKHNNGKFSEKYLFVYKETR
jgi:predicted SprT family Zn-dependent metalloprotease